MGQARDELLGPDAGSDGDAGGIYLEPAGHPRQGGLAVLSCADRRWVATLGPRTGEGLEDHRRRRVARRADRKVDHTTLVTLRERGELVEFVVGIDRGHETRPGVRSWPISRVHSGHSRLVTQG